MLAHSVCETVVIATSVTKKIKLQVANPGNTACLMLCLLSLFLGLQRDPVFSRKLHTLCPTEGPQVKDWSHEELIGLEFRDTQFWSNLKPWTKLKESICFMQQKSFSMAYLFCCSCFFIYLPSLPKAWLCHRNGVNLPWSHDTSQWICRHWKKNVRMLEKSTVIWNSYLRSENSSYWKGSRLQVVGFIPPAIDTVKPQMWWTLWKINSVDILYCMKLKKLFCMDTDLAEHLNYFLGAATCKKKTKTKE